MRNGKYLRFGGIALPHLPPQHQGNMTNGKYLRFEGIVPPPSPPHH